MLGHYFNKEMMQMDESRKEIMREEARRAKAIAVEKYKAGDLVGAKEFAVKAKMIFPPLSGLLRLIAVLDVRMGFEKKINGEVDWYAVLSVDQTANLATIQERHNYLYMAIILDSDDSVGSIKEAKEILADAWKYFDKKRAVQPPLKVDASVNQLRRSSGGGSKQKRHPSTDLIHVQKQKLTQNMIQSALVEKATSMVKLSLERYVPTSQHNKVGAVVETKTLQDSKECNAAKRVKIENKSADDMVTEEEPNVGVTGVLDLALYKKLKEEIDEVVKSIHNVEMESNKEAYVQGYKKREETN